MIKSTRLLVSFINKKGLPRSAESVGQIYADHLRESIKDWVAAWVDLSGLPNESAHRVAENDLIAWRESKGRIIQTHQFRKMWASFALAVDFRLLPVIQMHFHHLSLAMTEGGYIGNNVLQIDPLNSVRRQQTAMTLYEIALGTGTLAGRMGEQIEANIGELRSRLDGKSPAEAWYETVRFCDENDLRLWFAPHGGCLPLDATSMRCHELAGTASWLNKEPNYSTREPSVCTGCACFVLGVRHKSFWEQRYLQNWASYKKAEREGIQGEFRVIKERYLQAGKLLKKIGVDPIKLHRVDRTE